MRIDWSDLQTVLDVARAASLTAAAQSAGVHQSTMSRRLAVLEDRLGGALFHRQPLGPTELGARVVVRAEAMEAEVLALARDVAGQDAEIAGRVRIATATELAMWVLAPALPALAARHPGLDVELVCDDDPVLLARREADVAVRAGAVGAEGDVVAKPAGEIVLRILRRRGETSGEWLTLDPGLPWAADAQWVARHAPSARCRVRANSTATLLHAVLAGMGQAWLPPTLLRCYPELEEVQATAPPPPHRPVFVIVHRDLRRVPRIRAVAEWVGEALRRDDSQ